jgi:AAA domain
MSTVELAILKDRWLVARVIEEGIEPPEEQERGLLLRGKVHAFFSGPSTGKTMLLLWLINNAIQRRERVAFFDMENGLRIIAERLVALGVDASKVDELLYYIPFPNLALTRKAVGDYVNLLEELKPDAVFFDSWVGCLATAGLDENSSGDIATWSVNYVYPARKRGITVVLLDHVPHEGKRVRGSTRKKDEVDVQWRLSNPKPFNRDNVGEIVLHREKDRDAWLPPLVRFSVGVTPESNFVFERSEGGIVRASGDALTDKQYEVLEAIRAFGESGTSYTEWESESIARGV